MVIGMKAWLVIMALLFLAFAGFYACDGESDDRDSVSYPDDDTADDDLMDDDIDDDLIDDDIDDDVTPDDDTVLDDDTYHDDDSFLNVVEYEDIGADWDCEESYNCVDDYLDFVDLAAEYGTTYTEEELKDPVRVEAAYYEVKDVAGWEN